MPDGWSEIEIRELSSSSAIGHATGMGVSSVGIHTGRMESLAL